MRMMSKAVPGVAHSGVLGQHGGKDVVVLQLPSHPRLPGSPDLHHPLVGGGGHGGAQAEGAASGLVEKVALVSPQLWQWQDLEGECAARSQEVEWKSGGLF